MSDYIITNSRIILIKYSRSEKEKNIIAQQVIKATSKAQQKMEQLRQENNLLTFSITVLIFNHNTLRSQHN